MMNFIRWFLLFLLFNFALAGFHNTGNLEYGVELHVYSGRSNPTWVVTRKHPLYSHIAYKVNSARSTGLAEKLGYTGFTIQVRNGLGQRRFKSIGAGSNQMLELLLLRTNPVPMDRETSRYIIRAITGRRPIRPKYSLYPRPVLPPRPRALWRFCRHPRFDPENWNFEPVRSRNNCYNYATQQRTNTFAQPGRGSGREFSLMSPGDVLEATLRDGLILLPSYAPHLYRHVCYIALVIWPGVDFHFYRLDSNMLWSHKPGRTPVKNTDNSGNQIRDPRFADRGNYVVFAGFLGNHPRINIR